MISLKALSLLLFVGVVAAQYDYKRPQPPSTPRNTYLPPPTTTKAPYEKDEQIAGEGLNPDGEHEPGMPFDFSYAVKEDDGNDFSHQSKSDGDVVKGEYRVALPDGRTQIVRYTADWKNGYNAEIIYEGEAIYPEPSPTPYRPRPTPPQTTRAPYQPPTTYPTQRPTTRAPYQPPTTYPTQRPTTRAPYQPPRTSTKNPYENDEENDSQFITPSRPSPSTGYDYPRPTTTTRRPYTYTPPPTTRPSPPRTTPPPPTEPPGLYGAPAVPFGVRNNPKFGYSK